MGGDKKCFFMFDEKKNLSKSNEFVGWPGTT